MALKKNHPECFRGEIWLYNPDPIMGKEIGTKLRPAVILSHDLLNNGPAELVIVIPLTSKNKRIPTHVEIQPVDGSRTVSFAVCEQIRSVSKKRLVKRLGKIKNHQILASIADSLRDLLDFPY